MARNIPDLALFLDTMAGYCPLDPLTFDAPAELFVAALGRAGPPKRIAYSPDYNGKILVERETRAICEAAVRRFEDLGCIVEEYAPDLGGVEEAFMILRSQHFVVDRELQLKDHRDLLKQDIIWNTEKGLAQSPSQLAWADRERAAFYRRVTEMFERYDVFVTPSAGTPAFDVNRTHPETIDGVKLANYMGGSTLNAAMTMVELRGGRGARRLRPVRPPGRSANRGAAAPGSARSRGGGLPGAVDWTGQTGADRSPARGRPAGLISFSAAG